jgi:hypothetical protein
MKFRSEDSPGQPIADDFQKLPVVPTHYSIRSYSKGKNSSHPQTQVFEGSNSIAWRTPMTYGWWLCDEVFEVSRTEAFWTISFRQIRSNHHRSVRFWKPRPKVSGRGMHRVFHRRVVQPVLTIIAKSNPHGHNTDTL